MGAMSNDSTTVRKDQAFELMLAEYRGKVYGYSRSTFIVNDTLYYIVKKVKGTIEGDKCEVKDESIVSCNFQNRIDKGVKVISTFYRNQTDSNWYLAGDWKTKATKKFYAVSGKVTVKEETDYSKSELFPHLEELQLAQSLPNYQQVKQAMLQDVAHTSIRKTEGEIISNNNATRPEGSLVKTNAVAVDRDILYLQSKTDTKIEPEKQQAISANTRNQAALVAGNTTTVNRDIISLNEKTDTRIAVEKQENLKTENHSSGAAQVKTTPVAVNREVIYPATTTRTTIAQEKQQVLAKTSPQTPATEVVKTSMPVISNAITNAEASGESARPIMMTEKDPSGAAAQINERETGQAQVIPFKTDSLVIALYDNGEIDGDTISVVANGKMLMAKQGLKATAIRKTIYIPQGSDEFSLLLYAENLGKYPPNTGLMIVYDGDERHEVRFSADLQRNAAVIFRRQQ